jgi:hypothetical protein
MRILWSSLAVLALTVGCSGPETRFDYDVKANYTNFHTYDWYAAPKGVVAGSPIMATRVRRAVEAELTARNFRKETTADPDFLVTYYPSFQPRSGHRPHVGLGLGFGGRGLGVGIGVANVGGGGGRGKIGSIVLEIQDFKSHQVVWKAVAEEVLDDSLTPEDADLDVAKAVKKLLDRFPPSAKP